MINRREVAIALDIPLEMARKHGIPERLSKQELEAIQANPPAWLLQSMANRTGKRPVWVHLTCVVCGFSEAARPKKWWPEFTFVHCYDHGEWQLPAVEPGKVRAGYQDIGTQMVGIVDQTA